MSSRSALLDRGIVGAGAALLVAGFLPGAALAVQAVAAGLTVRRRSGPPHPEPAGP